MRRLFPLLLILIALARASSVAAQARSASLPAVIPSSGPSASTAWGANAPPAAEAATVGRESAGAMASIGDFWVGGGLGLGTAGLVIAFDVSAEVGGRLIQTRLTAQDNLAGWAGDFRTPELVTELGVMYGTRRWFSSGNQATAAAGLALVVGERGSDGADEFQTVGIPVQAQLISRGPLRLAITGLGNLNLEEPFVSFTLSLLLGRIR